MAWRKTIKENDKRGNDAGEFMLDHATLIMIGAPNLRLKPADQSAL